jgi:hypothetical protein
MRFETELSLGMEKIKTYLNTKQINFSFMNGD